METKVVVLLLTKIVERIENFALFPSFLPSFSLPDILCDPIDVIWT